jgi:hypothetical protein
MVESRADSGRAVLPPGQLPPAVAELIGLVERRQLAEPEDFHVIMVRGDSVVVTAPHAVPHLRASDPRHVKGADLGTGEIATAAAHRHGYAAAVAARPWLGNANSDPLGRCEFKRHVLGLLHTGEASAVVDLHGMSDRHGVDICVGSGGGGGLAFVVSEVLASSFSVSVDVPFAAAGEGTVTRTVRAAGFPAVQLELSAAVRAGRREDLIREIGRVGAALLSERSSP